MSREVGEEPCERWAARPLLGRPADPSRAYRVRSRDDGAGREPPEDANPIRDGAWRRIELDRDPPPRPDAHERRVDGRELTRTLVGPRVVRDANEGLRDVGIVHVEIDCHAGRARPPIRGIEWIGGI